MVWVGKYLKVFGSETALTSATCARSCRVHTFPPLNCGCVWIWPFLPPPQKRLDHRTVRGTAGEISDPDGKKRPSLWWHGWSGRCHLKGLFAISCNYSLGSNILICTRAVLLWLFQPTTTDGLLSNSHAGTGTAASTGDDSIAREEEKRRFWVQLGALTYYIWGCKFLCEIDKVSTFIFLPASAGVYST